MVEDFRSPRLIADAELESDINELMQLALETGERISEKSDRIGLEPMVAPHDIRSSLHSALRARLEDEIVPIHEITSGGLDRSEVDREIVKKALVGLKLATLKKIARDKGTRISGNAEDLATRIAREYEWDKGEVARLILANEDEPSIERAHVTRIFPLDETYDVTESRERLSNVIGRYIRIGVARWFLFEQIHEIDNVAEVSGTYKTYQASVDGLEEIAELSAHPHDATVRILLGESSMLQVTDANTVSSRAAVKAFEAISGTRALGYVPNAEATAKGVPGELHPISELLLDAIHNRIPQEDLQDINLTIARFRVRDAEGDQESTSVTPEQRPELKAVRFEGDHLFDSITACRLLTTERRALVDVAFRISVTNDEGVLGRFPVRISVERDHIVVQTGLGAGKHELSLDVHRKVIERISAAVTEGVQQPERIERLCERMRTRAQAAAAPSVADILSDDQS